MKRFLASVSLVLLAACASRPVEEMQAEEAASLRELGDEASKQGNFAQAIDFYSESIKLNPAAAETWYRRGNAFVRRPMDTATPNSRREWIRLAERDYTQAIARNAMFTHAYFNRAMVYMKTRRFIDAAKDLLEVTRLETNKSDPMLRDAELYLGEIYLTKLEDQQVLGMEHYDQYVKLGGDRPDIVKLVREWRVLKDSIARSDGPAAPKPPSADEEAAAKQLHTRIMGLIPKGEEQRPEVAKLIEELMGKYGHTQYVRDNEKGLKALQNAFKPK
jgi:tetratricopeptide (TPR) repeat protein